MAISASAVWRVRPSGSNTNGGGYDSTISGAGTDYSQQNAAQATGTHGTASGSTSFTDTTANAFTSAMVGNALQISSGSGITAGTYFVTAFSSSSQVTLDRSPGTGTVAVWHLGGAWADPQTNLASTNYVASGNIIYVLGSGIPTTSSYGTPDYTLTTFLTPVAGLYLWGDPATPSYSTGGMPLISAAGLAFYVSTALNLQNLWTFASSASNGSLGIFNGTGTAYNCVFDQNGYDVATTFQHNMFGCEVFSSVAKRSTNANPAWTSGQYSHLVKGCNFHDCIGTAIATSAMEQITDNIIAKNGGDGISLSNGGTAGWMQSISGNTIDGNAGNGIVMANANSLPNTTILNNLITNHTTAGKYGISAPFSTVAANDRLKTFIDYNVFYNNTANYSGISAGAHDTPASSNPYVAQSTENYSLA